MPTTDCFVTPTLRAYAGLAGVEEHPELQKVPRRTAPFDEEPGFHEPAGLWLYGNSKLLQANLAYIPGALGPSLHSPAQLDELERQTEQFVLDAKVMVSGIHNPAHQRVALVPLRWGAPRILVFSGGIKYHLGDDLQHEPFRAARLWRYQFDSRTDLVISRRAPENFPTFALYNATVDRMVEKVATSNWPGLRWVMDAITRVLA